LALDKEELKKLLKEKGVKSMERIVIIMLN
jgi:hypothetical protein